jgi:hypothetical protein
MKSWKNIFIPNAVVRNGLIVTHNLKWLSELNLFIVWLNILVRLLLSLEFFRSGLVFFWDKKLH